jgi:hypothetical protein
MTLQEAAKKLQLELGTGRPEDGFVFNIGIAEKSQFNPEDYMVVYWCDKRAMKRAKLPATYEGFRVESRYTGKIEIKQAEDGGI